MHVTIPKPCPDCGARGGLTLSTVWRAAPFGTASLAGVQVKTTARPVARLSCHACGTTRHGRLEGVRTARDGTVVAGHFVACDD